MAMESKQDPSDRKLVYLHERAVRPRLRKPAPDRKPAPSSIGELAGEAGWLARALLAVVLGVVAAGLLRASAASAAPRGSEDPQAIAVALAGSLSVIACCGAAAWRLLRAAAGSSILVAFAAGALALHGVSGVARALSEGFSPEPTLAHRVDVLAVGAGLAVAAWAASFASRLQRREPAGG
jgi:hypothetical protein